MKKYIKMTLLGIVFTALSGSIMAMDEENNSDNPFKSLLNNLKNLDQAIDELNNQKNNENNDEIDIEKILSIQEKEKLRQSLIQAILSGQTVSSYNLEDLITQELNKPLLIDIEDQTLYTNFKFCDFSILGAAIYANNVELVEEILYLKNLNLGYGAAHSNLLKQTFFPIELAIIMGHVKIVELLLNKSAHKATLTTILNGPTCDNCNITDDIQTTLTHLFLAENSWQEIFTKAHPTQECEACKKLSITDPRAKLQKLKIQHLLLENSENKDADKVKALKKEIGKLEFTTTRSSFQLALGLGMLTPFNGIKDWWIALIGGIAAHRYGTIKDKKDYTSPKHKIGSYLGYSIGLGLGFGARYGISRSGILDKVVQPLLIKYPKTATVLKYAPAGLWYTWMLLKK